MIGRHLSPPNLSPLLFIRVASAQYLSLSLCPFKTFLVHSVQLTNCESVSSGGWIPLSLSFLVEADEGYIGPRGKLLCIWWNQKIMQHMYGIIPYMLDLLSWSSCSSPSTKVLHGLVFKAHSPTQYTMYCLYFISSDGRVNPVD